MKKLVERFEKNTTIENAHKLIDYLDRHPMARCLVDTYQQTWIAIAEDMIDEASVDNWDDKSWREELAMLD